MRSSSLFACFVAAAAVVALMAIAFAVGRYPVSLSDLLSLLAAKLTGGSHALEPNIETVVLQIRGPRVLAALVVGGSLAAACTASQGMLRNPLGSPHILGVSKGAALGASLAIFLSMNVLLTQVVPFAGAALATRAGLLI